MRRCAVLAATVLALLAPLGAAALEAPVALRPTWGVLIEGLLDHSADSSISSPSINFNFGAGVVMPFSPSSRFSFEPSADLYWAYYEYFDERGVPTDLTFGSAFGLGLLLDLPVVYTLPLGSKFTLGFGVGACLNARVAFTIDSNKSENTPLINRYFWDKGRFATPTTLIRGEYKLTDRVGFGFTGRVLWPIYNLWAGEGYGFFDHGMYLVDLTILYRFKKQDS
jgi:hypothetical protein